VRRIAIREGGASWRVFASERVGQKRRGGWLKFTLLCERASERPLGLSDCEE